MNNSTFPASPRAGSAQRIIPELDGVRGIAVLLVMFCHSTLIQPEPATQLGVLLSLGAFGVDLFFVLSGFLISGILLDTRDAKNYFSSFYARRVLRIFPLYLLSVLAYFHGVLPLAHHFGWLQSSNNALEPWFWFHLSNWKLAYLGPVTWLAHFWSLAIEEQFYLCWPIVAFFAGRRWFPYVCLAVIGVSFGLRCVYEDNYFGRWFLWALTPFRLEPLAFGSLAAAVVRNGKAYATRKRPRFLAGMTACGTAMLLSALFTQERIDINLSPMTTYGLSSVAIIFSGLVLFAYVYSGSPNWLAALLRRPVLRSFGKYSYAIYVFHFPIFIAYGTAVRKYAAGLPEQWIPIIWFPTVVLGIGLAYLAALVSWNLLEKHFLALKHRFAANSAA